MAPVSDIIEIKEPDVYVRTMYAGNAVCKVKNVDPVKVLTVRPTAFEAAKKGDGSAAKENGMITFSMKNLMRVFYFSTEMRRAGG